MAANGGIFSKADSLPVFFIFNMNFFLENTNLGSLFQQFNFTRQSQFGSVDDTSSRFYSHNISNKIRRETGVLITSICMAGSTSLWVGLTPAGTGWTAEEFGLKSNWDLSFTHIFLQQLQKQESLFFI